MTEKEWLKCVFMSGLWIELNLRHTHLIAGRKANRRLRLFACACCRRIWELFPDDRCRKAIEVAERHAEGRAAKGELKAAQRAMAGAAHRQDAAPKAAMWSVAREAWIGAQEAASYATYAVSDARRKGDWSGAREESIQCQMLRDVFGNPFRPVALDPAWLTWNQGTIRQMARAIYDEGRFSDLPILADALEEAGCTNNDLLSHCRRPGEHVRGCWIVDLLLGKR
jgi:hypothetical protein